VITTGVKYRHVVFADAINLSRRPLNHAPQPQEIGYPFESHPSFNLDEQAFVRWVLRRAGIDVGHYRRETMARRLPACLRVLRAASLSHARFIIERDDELLHAAVSALIIGVTHFFRDPPVFDAIRDEVLPRISLRPAPCVWSVGCSDGSELYSVAILLAEMRALHRSSLLGTDCRMDAIRDAAEGHFGAAAMEPIPPALRDLHFSRDPADYESYVARPFLHGLLQWRCANVLHAVEPGPWDLILCRNMSMYLRPEAAEKLWKSLLAELRPGGYLVLGKAERPHGSGSLSLVTPGIYRRDT
jgi:chemotaxis methyl-accepting protein methylase